MSLSPCKDFVKESPMRFGRTTRYGLTVLLCLGVYLLFYSIGRSQSCPAACYEYSCSWYVSNGNLTCNSWSPYQAWSIFHTANGGGYPQSVIPHTTYKYAVCFNCSETYSLYGNGPTDVAQAIDTSCSECNAVVQRNYLKICSASQ